MMVPDPRQDGLDDSHRRRCSLAWWIALSLAGASAPYLVSAVREARERARQMPSVSCISLKPGGYEIIASGFPQAEVERLLRERLEYVASHAQDRPIGIRIRVTRVVGRGGLGPLCRFRRLTSLDLAGTQLDGSAIEIVSGLGSVQYLNLASTGITDVDADGLRELSALEQLDVRDTYITNAGIQRLRSALPRCTITVDQH
jgi:hypothetical protein